MRSLNIDLILSNYDNFVVFGEFGYLLIAKLEKIV